MRGQGPPLVSVLVPCHNHAPFVRDRLVSIAAQTMPRFEVVFIDDGSTDQSFEAACGLTNDSRFRFLRAPKPTGNPFAAWRLGMEEVRAPFVWIAESDDACGPDFLALLLEKFQRHDGLGMAYCQSMEIDAAGCEWTTLRGHTDAIDSERWLTDYVAEGRQECREALFFRNTIPNASACLFRADALRPALAATNGFSLCGDWAAYVDLLLSDWRIAFAATPCNRYRRHDGTRRQAMLAQGVEIMEGLQVKQAIKTTVEPEAAAVSLSAALTLDLLLHMVGRVGPMTASTWFDDGALLTAMTNFDSLFWSTLIGASANRWFWLDVLGERGPFLDPVRTVCNFAPNVPTTLTVRLPTRQVRIAVSRAPGLFFIERMLFTDAGTGRELAAYTGDGLHRVGMAGSCLALSRKNGLLLYVFGNDAVLIPPVAGRTGEVVLSLTLTGYSLVMDTAPADAACAAWSAPI